MAKPSDKFCTPLDPKLLWSSLRITTVGLEIGCNVFEMNSHPRAVILLSKSSRMLTGLPSMRYSQIDLTPSSSQAVCQRRIDWQWGYLYNRKNSKLKKRLMTYTASLRASMMALVPAQPSSSQKWNFYIVSWSPSSTIWYSSLIFLSGSTPSSVHLFL